MPTKVRMQWSRSIGLAFASASVGYAALASTQKPTADFQHDVLPIFSAHCSPCHTGTQSAGGLSFANLEGLVKGGDSGKSIIAHDSSASILVQPILGSGGKPRMPMGFKPLSDEDVAKIRAWIDAGAAAMSDSSKKHWAYVTPVRPNVPVVADSGWMRNPIDAFVLARLKKEGLKP